MNLKKVEKDILKAQKKQGKLIMLAAKQRTAQFDIVEAAERGLDSEKIANDRNGNNRVSLSWAILTAIQNLHDKLIASIARAYLTNKMKIEANTYALKEVKKSLNK